MSDSPTVASNKVVFIQYTLKDDKGEVLDSSDGGPAMAYLHGANNLVVGLEKALEGAALGQVLEVAVPPEEGYGVRSGPGPQPVPRSSFPEDAELEAGMAFLTQDDEGNQFQLWIAGFEGENVLIDDEHPLVDQTLHFKVEVTAIRDATEEEQKHGQPHGPGGHEH